MTEVIDGFAQDSEHRKSQRLNAALATEVFDKWSKLDEGLENTRLADNGITLDKWERMDGHRKRKKINDHEWENEESRTLDTPTIDSMTHDAGGHLTKETTFTLSGTSEACSNVHVFDDGDLLGIAVADGDGDWSIEVSGRLNGVHPFTAIAYDLFGNNSNTSSAFTVTVDTVIPGRVVITSPGNGSSYTGNSVTLTGTCDGDVTQVQVCEFAIPIAYLNASGGHWSGNVTGMLLGHHFLRLYPIDAAGNFGGIIDHSGAEIEVIRTA